MMITKARIFAVAILSALPLCAAPAQSTFSPETTIWFDAPAANFTESSPLGNGRLGAMMFGGVNEERIVLNENSLWSGSPQDADREDAYKALPEIRRLLLEGKNAEADALVNSRFTCKGPGSSAGTGEGQYGCYQVLGNLHLSFTGSDTNLAVEDYRRELNLNDAITRVTFRRGGIEFTREMFVSKPDEVMILRLTANQAKRISFVLRLDRPERFNTVPDGRAGLLMTGQLDNGTDGKGMRYAARVRILNRGGAVSADGQALRVSAADEVILLIAAATDYRGFAGRQLSDPVGATLGDLDKAVEKPWASLLRAHVADYQRYFQRLTLTLGATDLPAARLPAPKRVQAFKNGMDDLSLVTLYFNFGRYLLISSSRPGGLPPNLQGIWAEEIKTPWTADWHLDLNVQMNYWPAEVCNLSDLHQPLFALTDSLQEPGAKTARAYYGARGWVAHVITNPWGFTSPGESASWGAFNCGSAWLCQHLWEHWRFTHDQKFLAWAYPILKGSAQFYADLLIEDAKHQYLAIAPANSPENHFVKNGQDVTISLGTTMHDQMLRYLFSACIEASQILKIDADFRNELIAKRARLAPTRIGSDGRIMEWPEEYAESEPHHRHVSHLWGLYPADEITAAHTPELAQAARKSLNARGDEGVGWTLSWKAALWARLQDGERAWGLLRKALNPASGMEIRYDGGGGVYPNLFDASPPFQIDGNFGAPAAVAEMLLQNRDDEIRLLPALPAAWKSGQVTGLSARGGFEVGITWKDGKLVAATIRSIAGQACRVIYGGKEVSLKIKKGKSTTLDANLK